MNLPNDKRNKEMVSLRFADPNTYSYRVLGDKYQISAMTAHEIVNRDWETYLTKAQLKQRPKP